MEQPGGGGEGDELDVAGPGVGGEQAGRVGHLDAEHEEVLVGERGVTLTLLQGHVREGDGECVDGGADAAGLEPE